jgi:hypothetical protein
VICLSSLLIYDNIFGDNLAKDGFPQITYCQLALLETHVKQIEVNLTLIAPVQHLLRYEPKSLSTATAREMVAKYRGEPTPELDKNWNDLYNCMYLYK